jgi:hypothetical protein
MSASVASRFMTTTIAFLQLPRRPLGASSNGPGNDETPGSRPGVPVPFGSGD